mmetsp:Transcript_6446/g.9771  ORF Transcript_6446/g.9771 Transcript_6446/m.9771 type:complete len:179 (-) Transcript_6446:169-705(-)|eukprot:CAMPEP_0113943384 /NCGR_PEP_ID=MMETSP1339-20121228/23223_1 /TAXON_ID=94617 /ORGANISM="Fibrocapsa japonica" /LENGTH=178 /DNA_ID=CAMNT_0000948239 /DNA_START=148 /DNA_END=684 /DNA_ORIENTATION=+ /assembly_acc=CAM_ASM_000762
MGNTSGTPIPERPPVPAGKTRICVSGFGISHNSAGAKNLADAIVSAHPDKYESWYYFNSFGYKKFLRVILNELPDSEKGKESTMDKGTTVGQHHSSPFVWLESGGQTNADSKAVEGKTYEAQGGRDKFCLWAQKEFPGEESIQALASTDSPSLSILFFDSSSPGTWADASSSKEEETK